MFRKLIKRANDLWCEYWNWVMKLPDGISIALSLVTVVIPTVIFASGVIGILDWHFKTKCLDIQLARRWSPNHRICEEYHNDEWIEVDLSGGNGYYYNDTAASSH